MRKNFTFKLAVQDNEGNVTCYDDVVEEFGTEDFENDNASAITEWAVDTYGSGNVALVQAWCDEMNCYVEGWLT
jgi:hypothetical protein